MNAAVEPTFPETVWIADTATVRGDVVLGEDVSVWFSAVIRGDEAPIRIGARTNIQDGAVVHVSAGAPCVIGADVTVGHGAIVHACTVEDGCLIGMRATVLDGACIGAGSIVGAGAVVPPGMVVPAKTVVMGLPARIVGPVDERKQPLAAKAVGNYLRRKEDYRNGRF